MYRAAAYMRLSVANDRYTESESIANQEYIIRSFAQSNPDIEIISSHIDDGHSGLVFDRPGFMEMMQEVMGGKIDCIIVKDLSHFGRDFIETGRYLCKVLPNYGVRFISILDNVDTIRALAGDTLMIQVKTAINDEFSRDISVKTRRALQAMRQSGLYVGACPIYGYQKSGISRNQLIPDIVTASVVQSILR